MKISGAGPAEECRIEKEAAAVQVDARGKGYRELNKEIRHILRDHGAVHLKGVMGQRYIATGLTAQRGITIEGTPGNNLASFMDGPHITVKGNVQDGTANTMSSGRVVVHGCAGDILAYALRGGEVYVRGNSGCRTAIHMKQGGENNPVVVIGGGAGSFLGEYMAGGVIILLGLGKSAAGVVGKHCAVGMHGGVIYVRGETPPANLSGSVQAEKAGRGDYKIIDRYVNRFARYFHLSPEELVQGPYMRISAKSGRPYGNLYSKGA
jgi:glutamate synthase domain-containing protein 3